MIATLLTLLLQAGFAGEFQGVASILGTDQVFYTEKLNVVDDEKGFNKSIETDYVKKDGRLFARMKSDFSKNRFVPDSVFEDLRFRKKQELVFNPETKKITIRNTDLVSGKTSEKILDYKENMIAAQGFNNFLLAHFDELNNGKSIPVHFIVIGKMDDFKFNIFKIKNADSGRAVFGLNIQNLFFKLFVNEIQVEYDTKKLRLMVFKGLSNLLNDDEEALSVSIKYDYPKI